MTYLEKDNILYFYNREDLTVEVEGYKTVTFKSVNEAFQQMLKKNGSKKLVNTPWLISKGISPWANK